MKTNEAPEKIYLQDSMSTDTIGDLWPEWFDAKVSDNSIEYIRTDAFIEKACNFIDERLNFDDNAWYIEGEVTVKDKVIEDFKNYIKGG